MTRGREAPPKVIGLTGGIAAGKTAVSTSLKKRGAHVIDADSVGHAVIAPEGEAFGEVVAAFGTGVLGPDGAIDRRKLGAVVFGDAAQRARLNAISHPRMADRMAREIAQVRAHAPDARPPLIVLDAAILFEAGWDALCDETWAVETEAETAVARLMARNGLTRGEALARINAQLTTEERTGKAARVIRNDGSLEELEAAVEAAWRATVG